MPDDTTIPFNVHFEADDFGLIVYLEDDYQTNDDALIDRAFDLMRERYGIELVGKINNISVEPL